MINFCRRLFFPEKDFFTKSVLLSQEEFSQTMKDKVREERDISLIKIKVEGYNQQVALMGRSAVEDRLSQFISKICECGVVSRYGRDTFALLFEGDRDETILLATNIAHHDCSVGVMFLSPEVVF